MKLLGWLLAGNEWEIEGPVKDYLNLVLCSLARNKVTLDLGSVTSQHLQAVGHGWTAWLAGFIALPWLFIPYATLELQSRGLQHTLDGKSVTISSWHLFIGVVSPGMRALRALLWILRRIFTTRVPALLFFCPLSCSGEGNVLWSLSMWDRRLGHILSVGRPTHWIKSPTSCRLRFQT